MATAEQIRNYLRNNPNLTPEQIYAKAQQHGVSASDIDSAMNWTDNRAQNWVAQNTAPQPTANQSSGGSQYSNQQIKDYITNNNLTPEQIYNASVRYGVSPDQLDVAMGWQAGTAQNWINDNKNGDFGGGRSVINDNAPTPEYQARQFTPAESAQIQGLAQNNLGLGDAFNQYIYGNSAENPYLTQALQRGANQSQYAYDKMQDSATQNLLREVLPSLRSNSISNGMMGSSRQGIAEGMALNQFTRDLQNARDAYGRDTLDAMIGAQASEFSRGQDRGLSALTNLSNQQYNQALNQAQLDQQTALANAGHDVQTNLANLNAGVQLYGQNLGADTQRYGYDVSADTSRYNNWANNQTQRYGYDINRENALTQADTQTYGIDVGAQTSANQLDSQNTQWAFQNDLANQNLGFQMNQFNDMYNYNIMRDMLNMYGGFAGGTGLAPTNNQSYTNPWGSALSAGTTTAGLGLQAYNAFGGGTGGNLNNYNMSGGPTAGYTPTF